jgi:hypothetical protein
MNWMVKKWIARGPAVNRLCERERALRLQLQGIRQQLRHVRAGERCERDFTDGSSRLAKIFDFSSEWMCCIDLVIPIGPDDQQVMHVSLRQQCLEHIERGRVEPLQVVEKQREWMFLSREHAHETPEYELEAPLRVLWRKFGNRWLFANNQLEFGDQVDHQPPIPAQGIAHRLAPGRQFGLLLRQKAPGEALQGLA